MDLDDDADARLLITPDHLITLTPINQLLREADTEGSPRSEDIICPIKNQTGLPPPTIPAERSVLQVASWESNTFAAPPSTTYAGSLTRTKIIQSPTVAPASSHVLHEAADLLFAVVISASNPLPLFPLLAHFIPASVLHPVPVPVPCAIETNRYDVQGHIVRSAVINPNNIGSDCF